jgi:hypothetical protein
MNLKNTFTSLVFAALLPITNISAQQLNSNSLTILSAALTSKPQYEISSINNCKIKGSNLRNTGIGLFVFGIAAIGGGIAMVTSADGVTYYHSSTNTSSNTYGNSSGTQEEGSLTGAMGALGIIGGGLATAGGIVMWHFGQKKINRSNVKVNFTPTSAGICYSF